MLLDERHGSGKGFACLQRSLHEQLGEVDAGVGDVAGEGFELEFSCRVRIGGCKLYEATKGGNALQQLSL